MRTWTKKEIAFELGVSVRAVEENAKYLNLEPQKDTVGTNLYSDRDFDLISQLVEHCKDKTNSRNSFIPKTTVEILDDEPKVTKLAIRQNTVIDKYRESIDIALASDPLFDLELLQRISDNHWLLPASRLAPLFQITPSYLNSKKQYHYCGFIANKEVYVNGRSLWKVSANNS